MILCIECKSHIKKEPKYKQRSEATRNIFIEKIATIDCRKIVYLDEVGIDNNLVPLRGWSLKGKKTYSEQIAFKSERLSMIAGYRASNKEIIAPFEFSGYTDLNLFTGWFQSVLCPSINEGDYVIMDNAMFHKSEEIFQIAQNYKINILYLPPYSPDLNPIEHFWANFKSNLRMVIKKCANFKDAITNAFNKTLSG